MIFAPTALQEIPAPGDVESPLPGGVAEVVRFFLNFPQPLQIAGVVAAAIAAAVLGYFAWRHRAPIWAWLRTRPRSVYAAAAGAAILLAVGGVSAGVWGYNYVNHDNGFCTGCHVMTPAFTRFTESEHSQLECHDCHQQPLSASMWQLYLWVAERPEEVGEHSPVSTIICAGCHIQEDPEDSWERISATQGHLVHLESDSTALIDVQCVTCHGQEVHRFVPREETCATAGCHEVADTRIVLGEMTSAQAAVDCLDCHVFTAPVETATATGAAPLVPAVEQCSACHEMEALLAEFSTGADPHDAVCGACHNPHSQTESHRAFETCTSAGCHADPAALTPFHRGLEHVAVEDCAACHSAHRFTVDGSDCRSCHTDLS